MIVVVLLVCGLLLCWCLRLVVCLDCFALGCWLFLFVVFAVCGFGFVGEVVYLWVCLVVGFCEWFGFGGFLFCGCVRWLKVGGGC